MAHVRAVSAVAPQRRSSALSGERSRLPQMYSARPCDPACSHRPRRPLGAVRTVRGGERTQSRLEYHGLVARRGECRRFSVASGVVSPAFAVRRRAAGGGAPARCSYSRQPHPDAVAYATGSSTSLRT